MPWCEDCAKYYTPNSVRDDGTCPTCGRVLHAPDGSTAPRVDDEAAPWHFKLMVVLVAVYLGWRLVQLVT